VSPYLFTRRPGDSGRELRGGREGTHGRVAIASGYTKEMWMWGEQPGIKTM